MSNVMIFLMVPLLVSLMWVGGIYAKRTYVNIYDAQYYGAGLGFVATLSLVFIMFLIEAL
jgi:cytochrome c biogenesis protein CcdA